MSAFGRDTNVRCWRVHDIRHAHLKAVAAAGSDDTDRVLEKICTTVDDFYARGAMLRADNKLYHDFYLVQAKEPKELDKPWRTTGS